MLIVANSLCGVSDEQGGIRLLDTAISQETGITKEVIYMQCHDNAIFDISWSADDYKLVPHPILMALRSLLCYHLFLQCLYSS